jgi:hypothetical protein
MSAQKSSGSKLPATLTWQRNRNSLMENKLDGTETLDQTLRSWHEQEIANLTRHVEQNGSAKEQHKSRISRDHQRKRAGTGAKSTRSKESSSSKEMRTQRSIAMLQIAANMNFLDAVYH